MVYPNSTALALIRVLKILLPVKYKMANENSVFGVNMKSILRERLLLVIFEIPKVLTLPRDNTSIIIFFSINLSI